MRDGRPIDADVSCYSICHHLLRSRSGGRNPRRPCSGARRRKLPTGRRSRPIRRGTRPLWALEGAGSPGDSRQISPWDDPRRAREERHEWNRDRPACTRVNGLGGVGRGPRKVGDTGRFGGEAADPGAREGGALSFLDRPGSLRGIARARRDPASGATAGDGARRRDGRQFRRIIGVASTTVRPPLLWSSSLIALRRSRSRYEGRRLWTF